MTNKVTTPVGIRELCGILSPVISAVIDLFFSLLIVSFPGLLLVISGLDRNIFLIAPLVIAPWLYTFAAHRAKIPSLGSWALGIKRYSYSEIEEYSGVGVLYVKEALSRKAHTSRTIIFVIILSVLYSSHRLLWGPYAI